MATLAPSIQRPEPEIRSHRVHCHDSHRSKHDTGDERAELEAVTGDDRRASLK